MIDTLNTLDSLALPLTASIQDYLADTEAHPSTQAVVAAPQASGGDNGKVGAVPKQLKPAQHTGSITDVQKVIEQAFPDYWPAVEAGLATIATLLLKDNENPATLFYFGHPSSGKTTVTEMFSGHPITYTSMDFTPAAFVSHMANKKEEQLRKIDLLPRIRYKCLLSPEMAPLFAGKTEDLVKRLAVVTSVLDGRGYKSDSGTHGTRGYEGDYLFSWIGCTVPFRSNVWKTMGHMGSRMLFWPMPDDRPTQEELMAAQEGPSYKDRLSTCKNAVHAFLTSFLGAHGPSPIRSVRWDVSLDPEPVRALIAQLAMLLAAARSKEKAFRAQAMLMNFARGHALIHGRQQLTEEDLPRTAQLAVGSVPEKIRLGFTALIRAGGPLTVSEAASALGCSVPTAQIILEACEGEVMQFVEQPQPAHLRLRDEWGWCMDLVK